MNSIEPPNTLEEKAQLEAAVAEMLEGREQPSRWFALSELMRLTPNSAAPNAAGSK